MTLLDADKQNDCNTVGEDTQELFETIERSFGVNLGDFDLLAGVRVSELAEIICKVAKYPTKEKCLSAVVFYKLRQTLEDLFGIPLKSVRPNTPLRRLLPWRSRRTRWHAMQEHLELTLPRLVFPNGLLLFCIVFPVALQIFAKEFIGFQVSWPGLFGYSFIWALPMVIVCIPFARSLPVGCETVGDLAKAVLAQNYSVFATSYGGSSKEDVFSTLQLLVAFETGRRVSEVFPETRIPSDLNIC